ncbi:CoA-disulfide reductase [Vibrio sp. L3-7]|uniref:CoA-disulfide reductase n=1 Tax=Vibrio sp. L3-7 TaxID=2912253 RepID=UPI001194FA16|nr:CoA-disulfide reductase [Vibrio sp. L3-7]MCF7502651.1 CoA-disulfide reductase [Vibrio sp. L3-7]TVU78846.1 CoA-disulfide reductase [Vibrio tasmaniensis]
MKIVILGGSAAGMSFAAKYKRNQPTDDVIVIEKRNYLSFGACGLPYFVGDKFPNTERMIARTPQQAIDSGLDVRMDTEVVAVNTSEQIITVDTQGESQEIPFDKLIVATGARPLIPDFAASFHVGNPERANSADSNNTEHIYTLTSMEDGVAVKQAMLSADKPRVAIIGAGFIGLEVFDAAHDLGKDVTIIEREAHIMSRQFSPEMISDVEDAIRNTGTNLLTNTQVEHIESFTSKESGEGSHEKNSYLLTVSKTAANNTNETTSNSAEPEYTTVQADIVILALGFKPNTDLFDLPKIPNGALLVDKFGATPVANIYAVGDCATVHHLTLDQPVYLPLATTANKQARMMADRLAGKETFLDGFLGSPSLKVLDYELASTGISHWMANQHAVPISTSIIKDKNQTDYYPGQEDIKIKLAYDPESKRLLGGEIVGKKGAVARLNALSVAITAGMTTQQLGYLDFSYAPPFARTWDALNVAGNVSK